MVIPRPMPLVERAQPFDDLQWTFEFKHERFRESAPQTGWLQCFELSSIFLPLSNIVRYARFLAFGPVPDRVVLLNGLRSNCRADTPA